MDYNIANGLDRYYQGAGIKNNYCMLPKQVTRPFAETKSDEIPTFHRVDIRKYRREDEDSD